MDLKLTADDVRPIVDHILERVLVGVDVLRDPFKERLSLRESEAAEALGLATHQLRDARLRGLVTGKKVGKSVLYSRKELERFLSSK